MNRCDFRLVIVKGLIEHHDGTAYFGSLGGYATYYAQAEELGWIARVEERDVVTDRGREVYHWTRLAELPKQLGRRAYLWDWSTVPDLPASLRTRVR